MKTKIYRIAVGNEYDIGRIITVKAASPTRAITKVKLSGTERIWWYEEV